MEGGGANHAKRSWPPVTTGSATGLRGRGPGGAVESSSPLAGSFEKIYLYVSSFICLFCIFDVLSEFLLFCCPAPTMMSHRGNRLLMGLSRVELNALLRVSDPPGGKHPLRTSQVGVNASHPPLYHFTYPCAQQPAGLDHRWTLRSRIFLPNCSSRLRPSPIEARFSDSPRSAGTGTMSSLGLPPFGLTSIVETNPVPRFCSKDPNPVPSTLQSIATCQRRFHSLPATPTE